jgi:hypothetical protein
MRRLLALAFAALMVLSACYEGPGARPPLTRSPDSSGGSSGSAAAPRETLALVRPGAVELVRYGDRTFVVVDRDVVEFGSGGFVSVGALPEQGTLVSRVAWDADRLLVATSDGVDVDVWVSTNGAESWATLGTFKFQTIDPVASIRLAAHGQEISILAAEQSGSAFSFAQLARTEDGGRTWETSTAPTGGEIGYAGGWYWIAGGVSGNEVYRSKDGIGWTAVRVPVDAADWTGALITDAGDLGAILPITIHDQDRDSTVRLFTSIDGGDHWAELGETRAPASASGSAIPSAVGPDGTWVVVYPNGEALVIGSGNGAAPSVLSMPGLATEITDVLLVGNVITVSASPGSCPAGKESCTSATVVLQSTDLGQTWAELE